MAPRRRAGKEPTIETGPSHQAEEVEEIEQMDPLERLAHAVEDEDFCNTIKILKPFFLKQSMVREQFNLKTNH